MHKDYPKNTPISIEISISENVVHLLCTYCTLIVHLLYTYCAVIVDPVVDPVVPDWVYCAFIVPHWVYCAVIVPNWVFYAMGRFPLTQLYGLMDALNPMLWVQNVS